MERALLEVIALDADDATAAQAGGADRLELVADIAADGLTPAVSTLRDVLAAVDIPVRVMLRDRSGFAPADLDRLRRDAAQLRDAGATEFVLGFLTEDGDVDRAACTAVLAELDGCPWTFHRAVDNAADIAAAWRDAAELGCDTILSAGSAAGVGAGFEQLTAGAAQPPFDRTTLLVGGGLQLAHLAPLRAAGIRAFHTGSAVRAGGWHGAVDSAAVRAWVSALH